MEHHKSKVGTSNHQSGSKADLRPCPNCSEQIERDYIFCWNCGIRKDALQLSSKGNEDSKINTDERQDRRDNSNLPLGWLYQLSLNRGKKLYTLPDIASKVPDLDYLGAFYYEDLVRRLKKDDFDSWDSLIKESDVALYKIIEPYKHEVYCRGKSIFIGIELRSSGVWNYKKWSTCLITQLNQKERKIIGPYTSQIYQQVKQMMEENSFKGDKVRLNKSQRITVLIGIAILLLMFLFPPWRATGGSIKGYYFVFYPPSKSIEIDITRLFVQSLFIIVLTAGGVFLQQQRK